MIECTLLTLENFSRHAQDDDQLFILATTKDEDLILKKSREKAAWVWNTLYNCILSEDYEEQEYYWRTQAVEMFLKDDDLGPRKVRAFKREEELLEQLSLNISYRRHGLHI